MKRCTVRSAGSASGATGAVRGERLFEPPARVQPVGVDEPAAGGVSFRDGRELAAAQHRVDPYLVEQPVEIDGEDRQHRHERVEEPAAMSPGRAGSGVAEPQVPAFPPRSRCRCVRPRGVAGPSRPRPPAPP